VIRIYGRVLSEDASTWCFAPATRLEPAAGLSEPGRVNKGRYGVRYAVRYGLDALLVPTGAPVPFTAGRLGHGGASDESEGEQRT